MFSFLSLRSWPGFRGVPRSYCSDANFTSVGHSFLLHAAHFGPGQSGKITFIGLTCLVLVLKNINVVTGAYRVRGRCNVGETREEVSQYVNHVVFFPPLVWYDGSGDHRNS